MLRLSNFGPHARMLGMVILWGASWPAGRIVAQAMPPLAAASLRFVLAALEVPPERFDDVAACVNAQPEVAHNYRREHALNMWFVVAAESPEVAQAALARIGRDTGLQVHAFPKEREYFVELRLPLRPHPTGADDAR